MLFPLIVGTISMLAFAGFMVYMVLELSVFAPKREAIEAAERREFYARCKAARQASHQ